MKIKDLQEGDIFRFKHIPNTNYKKCGDRVHRQCDDKFLNDVNFSCEKSPYWPVELISKGRFDFIAAIQHMKEGKRVHYYNWDKGEYIYLKDGKFHGEDGKRWKLCELEGLDIDEWELYIGPVVVNVPLNAEYTAKISANGVEVGCQRFPLEKIDELYRAYLAVKNSQD